MLKFLCLFFIFVNFSNAGLRNSTFHVVKVSGGEENPYVDVKETKGKTEITWKTDVDQTSSPLRATLSIHFINPDKTYSTHLENLCEVYKDGAFEGNAQKFMLKALANIEKCPIRKAATSSIPNSFSLSYSTDHPVCGDIRNEFEIFKQGDSNYSQLLITGMSTGTVTGC